MNYKRTKIKNASLRGEKWAWVKIVLFTIFMLLVSLIGPEIIKFLN